MTDCLLIPLNFVKINNYATVEERKRKKEKKEEEKREDFKPSFPFPIPLCLHIPILSR